MGPWGSLDILEASGSPFLKQWRLYPERRGLLIASDPGSNPGGPAMFYGLCGVQRDK